MRDDDPSAEFTVVVADGHPVVRRSLSASLESATGIRVVAAVSTGREAVREVLSNHVDVLVVDLSVRDHRGLTAIREILRMAPGVAVLVFTVMDDDESVTAALRAGARGYFLKDADQCSLVRAIPSVAAGSAIFCPRIASRLGALLPDVATPPRILLGRLTVRELDVLELVAAGWSNTMIARRFRLAPKTIRNHNSAIFAKLRVAGRAEAIARAQQLGMG